ncbi:MAG: hypothetical protein ANABAC_1091 [Anaerolineae bacterium]|nr:MAG: hypothetical protein ANABAC_1091 [Anaerolineae bacterium]
MVSGELGFSSSALALKEDGISAARSLRLEKGWCHGMLPGL